MSDALEDGALSRWRQQPISFIEQVLRNPEDGKPFELLDAQKEFFAHAWTRDEAGRLVYPEQCYGAIRNGVRSSQHSGRPHSDGSPSSHCTSHCMGPRGTTISSMAGLSVMAGSPATGRRA